MSTRERLTWGGGKSAAGPTLPVEIAARRASAHPQTPDEGITHPAGYPDPTQPDAYENGDTSSWAEDPHAGPYRTSPQPANPMDDGGYRHPAAQPGAPAKNAATNREAHAIRIAAEQKAAKCIHLASALLGEQIAKAAEESDAVATEMIEAQALAFMNLADEQVDASLRRLEAATEDEEVLLRKMLAEEQGEEDDETEDEESTGKEASNRLADEMSQKFAEVSSALAALQAQVAGLATPKKAEEKEEEEEDAEAMLAAMIAEEEAKAKKPETETEAAAMLAEQEPQPGAALADFLDDDLGINMDPVEDPLGLGFDEPPMMDDDEDMMALFASNRGRTAEEEVEVEEEKKEEPKKEASNRVASRLKPQARKPNAGVQSVGAVRVAASGNLDSDLAKLWASAPDVSRIFNS